MLGIYVSCVDIRMVIIYAPCVDMLMAGWYTGCWYLCSVCYNTGGELGYELLVFMYRML